MKSLQRILIGATALFAIALPSLAQVKSYKDIKTPALRKVNPPQPKRIQLDNGMVIYLMVDHELPLIRGTAHIRGGDREEPAENAGLVDIFSQSWRTGGTQTKTGDELDEFLESRAARIETLSDDDSSAATLDVLKEDFDTVFPVYLDLLRNPAFRQDKIDLAKTFERTLISRRNDEPGQILAREIEKLGYGPNSPYTHQPEYATLNAITRDDLLAFHKRFVNPNNIIFGVVGDFDPAQMEAKLRQAFGSWPRGPQAPAPSFASNPAKPGLYFVSKTDVTQGNIAMVHPGIQRNSPDYYAVAVMNEILNNGSSGRLMQHLRTNRGLTYGVGGSLGAGWDHPGLFMARMATKSGTTLESIDALKGEINDLITKPFTAEELAQAKESVLNAFVFTMDSPNKVLNQQILLEFYGFPADYYRNYTANIDKVTTTDVARVAKKYVNPNQLAVLVVGNEKDFEKPLTTLGLVSTIDVTIPEGDSTQKSAVTKPAAGNAEGSALLKKVVDFVGGKAKLDAINAVRSVTTANRKTPQGAIDMEVDEIMVFPDRQRAVMKMPMGEVTMVMTPEASFMVLPGMGTRDVPASQRDAARAEARQEMLTVLKNPDKYTLTVTGTEKINGVDAKVLEVSSEGDAVKWYVDPATGKVLRKVSRGRGPMAQGDQVTDFTTWGTYGGVTLPSAFTTTVNGEQFGSGQVKSVEINPAVDPKMWEKPAS